jgi:hypothetical protein
LDFFGGHDAVALLEIAKSPSLGLAFEGLEPKRVAEIDAKTVTVMSRNYLARRLYRDGDVTVEPARIS